MKKFLLGLAVGLSLVLGAAFAVTSITSTTVNGSYFGYNPATGLETMHGADVAGGVAPTIGVSGSSCAMTSVTGGASAGQFVQTGGTSCTFTITYPSASPNGWNCYVNDLTTPADGPVKAASTTTTVWTSGATTVVSGDTFQYVCEGY